MGSRILALVRPVPDTFAGATAHYFGGGDIDVPLARAQHATYVAALRAAGAEIICAPAAHDLPDSCFVEDQVVVLAERAVLTRSGLASRRLEHEGLADLLSPHLTVIAMRPTDQHPDPQLDGGDVLRLGDVLFVGLGERTNASGLALLEVQAARVGLRIVPIEVEGTLHLKCVCSPLGGAGLVVADTSLGREVARAVRSALPDAEQVVVSTGEAYAANLIALPGGHVLISDVGNRLAHKLERRGHHVHRIQASELRKADGSLTCLSVIWSS